MPIYEYQCENCGHELEAIQKISDAPLTDCPECKQSSLRKLISASAFQLKGTGWYVTDFRDKNKAQKSNSDNSDSNSSSKGKESKKAKSEDSAAK